MGTKKTEKGGADDILW